MFPEVRTVFKMPLSVRRILCFDTGTTSLVLWHIIQQLVAMFICATIVYFAENPVGYDLYKTANGFELRRPQMTRSGLTPPVIIVEKRNGDWHIQGTDCEEVTEQVIKLVKMNGVITLRGGLSAAS